jgi:hypothetical protein
MSAIVSASAATGGARFLDHAAEAAGALASATGGSPFFAVVVGLLAVMAAMALAVELLVRAAAVYIVVLMLPLAFAALVWPARRIWAVRLVELLSSLILSKFVIVAVLSLAGAAFTTGTPGIGELLVAMSLILLSTFAPWALMRILPFTELAAGAAGILRNELPQTPGRSAATGHSLRGAATASELPARLQAQARMMYAGADGGGFSSADGDAEPAPARTPASDPIPRGGPELGFDESPVATAGPAGGAFDGHARTASPHPPTAAIVPDGSSVASGAGGGAAGSDGRREDGLAPYVLPAAWRSETAQRLDGDQLGGSGSAPPPASDGLATNEPLPRAQPENRNGR